MKDIIKKESSDIETFKELASWAIKSGKYPDLDNATLINIMLSARDLGVSPMKAINGGFYIVKGKISMSTALMVDRIRSAGHSIKIIEWTSQKCVIIGQRKDNGDSVKLEFTMEDATKAGIADSITWKKYPKNMLYNRAMSNLARVLFPDVVGNCYSEDEGEEIGGRSQQYTKVDLNADTAIEITEAEVSEEAQEPSITLDEAINNTLSDEQIAELDSYLIEDPDAEAKITSFLKIKDIYEMNPFNFPGIIKTLKRRKEQREASYGNA